jgi:hypothetical protein
MMIVFLLLRRALVAASGSEGYLEACSVSGCSGWSCEPGNLNPLQVALYYTPAGSTTFLLIGNSTLNRPDVYTNAASCGCPSTTNCVRGFNISWTEAVLVANSGKTRTIVAFGISKESPAGNNELKNSFSVTFPSFSVAPTPAPTHAPSPQPTPLPTPTTLSPTPQPTVSAISRKKLRLKRCVIACTEYSNTAKRSTRQCDHTSDCVRWKSVIFRGDIAAIDSIA